MREECRIIYVDSDGLLKMRTALLLLYILYKHIWFTSWSSGNLQVGMLMRLFFLRDNNSLEQKKKNWASRRPYFSFFYLFYMARPRTIIPRAYPLPQSSIVIAEHTAVDLVTVNPAPITDHLNPIFFSLLRNKKKSRQNVYLYIFFSSLYI